MSEKEKSGLESLFDNKILRYVGTYIAVGFGFLQFLVFAVDQYGLGNHWIDRFLLVWIALLPALLILLYFGDKLGVSGQPRWPKYAIASNVVLALALGGLGVQGEAADAVEVVELTNEEGETIQTLVPSLNKIKSLASFQMENATGDEDLDWWGVALANLLELNMDQRPEFYSRSPYGMYSYYESMGLKDFKLPSVGMQREMTQKARSDYFTRMSYELEDGDFLIKGKVYKSVDGKSVIDLSVRDADPYVAIDKIKKEISENIPDALEALENEESLPASTLISNNPKALEYYTKSKIASAKNPNATEEVISLMRQAIEEDAACGMCYFNLGQPLYNQGKQEEAISALQSAVRYSKSLPERMQFGPKEILYAVTNNMDAYISLQEMRRKMFPYDFSPYEQLQFIYMTNYGVDSTKQLMQEAIDNGNVERGLLAMYGLQLRDNDYAGAERSLDQLKAEFPDRDQDRLKYAEIYESQGRLDDARVLLKEEETLDPLDAGIQTRLAYNDFRNEKIDAAYERLKKGLGQSMTLSDSINFTLTKRYFLSVTGHVNKALEAQEEYDRLSSKQVAYANLLAFAFNIKTDLYLSIGDGKSVEGLISELGKYTPEAISLYKCIAKANAVQRDYPFDQLDLEIGTCVETFNAYGNGYRELFQAMKAYQDEDFAKAVEILDGDDGRLKDLFYDKTFIAEVYNRAGRNEEAQKLLQKEINKKVDDPIYYYEMAHLLQQSDPATAKTHLERAIRYWEGADEAYIPKKRAEALLEKLN